VEERRRRGQKTETSVEEFCKLKGSLGCATEGGTKREVGRGGKKKGIYTKGRKGGKKITENELVLVGVGVNGGRDETSLCRMTRQEPGKGM